MNDPEQYILYLLVDEEQYQKERQNLTQLIAALPPSDSGELARAAAPFVSKVRERLASRLDMTERWLVRLAVQLQGKRSN